MYRFNPDIVYYVNISGIQLHDKKNSRVIDLEYPEAAVFDLLMKKLPDDKIIRMISEIFPENQADAEKIFRDTTGFLLQNKIITMV